MAFGGAPLWADGTLTLRVRGSGFGAGRPLTIRRPFALLGRGEGCDIRIDDPTVGTRHAYLHMDRRGIFVVDLATRSGIRFNDVAGTAGWLRPGQALEVAGRRIEIVSAHIDGVSSFSGPNPRSLLADAGDQSLARLSLRDESAPENPWTVDSELLFIGRSASCGVRVDGEAAARIHAVVIRGPNAAYLVDLSGRGVVLNGQLTTGAAPLVDGDHLHIGSTRFTVHVAPPTLVDDESEPAQILPGPRPPQPENVLPVLRISTPPPEESHDLQPIEPASFPAELLPPLPPELLNGESQATMLGWMMGVLQATQGEMMRRQDDFQHEVVQALRQMHQDNQEVMARHLNKVDRLQRDLSALREEIRQRYGPTAHPPITGQSPGLPKPPPLRVTPPPPADSEAAASWLLNRVNQLDAENRSSWRELLSRITSAPKT
jgi:pSer/pThr/pTyr-binding forkhead associated (FHA) protein